MANVEIARGNPAGAKKVLMNNMDIIKNAITICMAYCIKAIISPTWMAASAT